LLIRKLNGLTTDVAYREFLVDAVFIPALRHGAYGPRRGIFSGSPTPAQQHEDKRIGRRQPRQTGTDAGHAHAQWRQPGQPVPIGEHAHHKLGKSAAERRSQRQPGCTQVAESTLQHEVGHGSRDESLVEIVDCVRARPDAHRRQCDPPRSGASSTPTRSVLPMALTMLATSTVALPILCLFVSQIRHAALAPTYTASLAAGELIERHQHDDHQLTYVSTGVLAIQTDRGSWVAPHDRAVWVPAGLWHQHRFYGHSRFHTIGFALGKAPLPEDSPTIVTVNSLLRELLIASTDVDLPVGEARHIRAVLRDRLHRATVAPLILPTPRDPRLADACQLVENDLRHNRTLSWLGRAVNTSDRTLTRLFRTEFGTTYPQWRTNVRIFHAMIALAQGQSVTETAQRCGWATTSGFIDTFARAMGQTPGLYRSAAVPTPPA